MIHIHAYIHIHTYIHTYIYTGNTGNTGNTGTQVHRYTGTQITDIKSTSYYTVYN